MNTSTAPTRRSLLSGALVLCGALLLTLGQGCSTLEYTPRANLVQEHSFEWVSRRLRKVLGQAVEPPVASVRVKPDSFTYTTFTDSTPIPSIRYLNVERVDLYAGAWALVYSRQGDMLARFQLLSQNDAYALADLLASLQSWAASKSATQTEHNLNSGW
ncbi:MAG: hypothetical protein JKY65_10215 [Planctomycetes bacterium]|nr:hypothetical protein [Planctomycetota bacterium]